MNKKEKDELIKRMTAELNAEEAKIEEQIESGNFDLEEILENMDDRWLVTLTVYKRRS